MSLFKNVTSDSSIANERDSVGGSRVLESGLIPMTVALAYGITASSGALGLVVALKGADKQEHRETLWMTSGTAKGGKNYYEKDGQKHYLPGYLMANALCLLTVGKEISELETEQKVVPVYSKDAKTEVPTKVDMLVDLLGKEILVGMIKQTVDKTAKVEGTNEYVPTGETREENTIDKFFRSRDRMTTAEILARAETAAFADTWAAKWTGVTRNRATGAAGTGKAGAPKAAGTAGAPKAQNKPTQSLFA